VFVNGIQEKYGLNWDGKHIAVQLADATANGTLMPCPEDSVDWDTTQHLMIEGDNVEAPPERASWCLLPRLALESQKGSC